GTEADVDAVRQAVHLLDRPGDSPVGGARDLPPGQGARRAGAQRSRPELTNLLSPELPGNAAELSLDCLEVALARGTGFAVVSDSTAHARLADRAGNQRLRVRS